MKILIFNLRDISNPSSGGAEVFTYEVAKRWVDSGNEVTMVVSGFKKGAGREILENVEIIRLGNMYSVFWLARIYYEKHCKGKYDVIIDEYTLRPFMAPKFVKEPVIFLAFELAREKWFCETHFPLSYIGYYFLEPRWLKNFINIPTVTISKSTEQDLQEIGFKTIYIVPIGINLKPFDKIPEKEKEPTLLFVGLLKKANLADHAIKALQFISKQLPSAKLWVVGKGKQRKYLEKLAKGFNVTFFGYVSEETKLKLMSRAHVLLAPAVREGWGLVVTEANACGTPAIGYNVHGLRDSINDGITGLLTANNPMALTEAILTYFDNAELRQELSKNALEWSRCFSWDETAAEFMKVIKDVVHG